MKTFFIKWHNALIWFGLASLLIWALSGISHPLMAWFGPQAVKSMPPSLTMTTDNALAVQTIIRQHRLGKATIAKMVPTQDGPMLQVTEQSDNNTVQRRYFSLADQQEKRGYDAQQARWLASYYTGLPADNIGQVSRIDSFSSDYPWVNRLLPVYRVSFTGDEGLSAYVYTETNALASLNNSLKQTMQGFFQQLHTWKFLDATGFGRVLLVGLLMLILAAMAVTGLMLVLTIARRPIQQPSRRWHRILAYTLWLPLLAWPASGFYHLLQAQYVDSVAGIRLGDPVDLQKWLAQSVEQTQWQRDFTQAVDGVGQLNAVSLVHDQHNHFYRLSLSNMEDKAVSRQARFDGQAAEKSVLYIDSQTGQLSQHTDRDQALALLASLKGDDIAYHDISLVTRFGPDYDFRNKRLPVWQINLDDADQTYAFVDPLTGILVDQNRQIDRWESLSFSLLHKWNHLFPLIGRQWRDGLIVLTLLVSLVLAGFGIQMHFARKARLKKQTA